MEQNYGFRQFDEIILDRQNPTKVLPVLMVQPHHQDSLFQYSLQCTKIEGNIGTSVQIAIDDAIICQVTLPNTQIVFNRIGNYPKITIIMSLFDPSPYLIIDGMLPELLNIIKDYYVGVILSNLTHTCVQIA